MKTIKFKIQHIIAIPLDIPLEQMRKFPTKSSYLYKQQEEIITHRFDPCKNFDEKGYIKVLKQELSKPYNITSIEIIE